jgi:putative transposase
MARLSGRDLLTRGLRSPALLVADGGPGRRKAARELWPAMLERRSTVHALRNATQKLREPLHRGLKVRCLGAAQKLALG